MNESQLQKISTYNINPRDAKVYSDRGFVILDNGRMGESQWTCLYIKDKKSFYFDSFGVAPDKFLLKQLPKSLKYTKYKFQDINSQLCGSYCLYFFYLVERMNLYDAILKMYFESIL